MLKLHLSAEQRYRIIEAAHAAMPNECCGLLEGERTGDFIRVVAVHPTANLADDPARGFEIDPAPHLRLRCRIRGTGRAVVGCYHSHPNGLAGPSSTDRARNADGEPAFVWVIVAVMDGEPSLNAFAGPAFEPVVLT